MKRKINFAVFSPNCKNIHLVKTPGMISYILHREYEYNSFIICYKNEKEYLKDEVPGIKLLFIKKGIITILIEKIIQLLGGTVSLKKIKFISMIVDAIPIFLKYGKYIDVLAFHQFDLFSIAIPVIYRVTNKKGVLYLKLDSNPFYLLRYETRRRRRKLYSHVYDYFFRFASFNIVVAETKILYKVVRNIHPLFKELKDKIIYLPNGIDMKKVSSSSLRNFDEKENIILHVGRIGIHAKGSEIAVKAFINISKEFPDWRLILVGSIEKAFAHYLEKLLKNNDLSNRIIYMGFIASRDELFDIYNRTKILIFPSRHESFGLTLVEAGAFGNVIISSNIFSAREITNNGKFGHLCPVNDIRCFTEKLRCAISHKSDSRKKSELISNFIKRNYDWNNICSILHNIIIKNISK